MSSQTELEFGEFDAKNKWNEVFQRLKNEASLASLGDNFSSKFAREPDNRRKNRYRDVSPYDHSRVSLSGDIDYINASFVNVPEANRKYILTQGPLEHTMCDFWQMVWEQQSKAIVMLNRVVEKGTVKCSQYFPLGANYGADQEMYFPECGLQVLLTSEQDFQHFTLRTLELEHIESGDKREILHFHYTTWPDFGVPSSPNAFLHFLHCVRETGTLEDDVGPAVIHCSAGIGRSGTFCLVDSCLVMVENSGTLKHINVRKLLIEMRTYRMGLIQTSDQLRFSYLAIIEGAHATLMGDGLAALQVSSLSWNHNHTDNQTSKTSVQTSKTPHPPEPESPVQLDLLHVTLEQPPPLPPKTSPVPRHSCLNGWGEEEESGDEDRKLISNDDENDEEFDQLIDRIDGDELDDNCDSDEEIRAADINIKLDRKERNRQWTRFNK
uniref:protein-tyrosine-phosphatase n=1 Tax=Arion vulgaris TaxID=1028688 RepID=A0A0B7A0U4_9EUPU